MENKKEKSNRTGKENTSRRIALEAEHETAQSPNADLLYKIATKLTKKYGAASIEANYADICPLVKGSGIKASRDDIEIKHGFAIHSPTGIAIRLPSPKIPKNDKDIIAFRKYNAEKLREAIDKLIRLLNTGSV